MRRALAALVVTVVAVVLLAGYETRPPRTVNPHSPLYTAAKARAAEPPRAVPRRQDRGRRADHDAVLDHPGPGDGAQGPADGRQDARS